jgi:hypothetical protein
MRLQGGLQLLLLAMGLVEILDELRVSRRRFRHQTASVPCLLIFRALSHVSRAWVLANIAEAEEHRLPRDLQAAARRVDRSTYLPRLVSGSDPATKVGAGLRVFAVTATRRNSILIDLLDAIRHLPSPAIVKVVVGTGASLVGEVADHPPHFASDHRPADPVIALKLLGVSVAIDIAETLLEGDGV